VRSNGSRCVACHTVSRDGRYLSGALWGGGLEGAVFDMANPAVKTADPAPTVTPLVEGSSYTVLFSTFNEDASRLMINRGTGLEVIDPKNGATVATTGLPTSGVAHPTWSPDGKTVAFVRNIMLGGNPAGWAVDYDRGDLAVMPVTAPDTFGAPVTLVAASTVDPAFSAPSWPSFSPDSRWIAYGAGVNSRGRNDSIGAVYPGALFVIDKDAGVPYRLDTACGGARDCYLPNFSPYDDGGYFWLVFYSTRDYGNAQAGTKGTSRRQLWVTAISKSKLGTGDPSSVPYWLPDQDVATQNMSAYWALPPPLM
jgi:Tol biopolymer transport system component